MLNRFSVVRNISGSFSDIIGQFDKSERDDALVRVSYEDVLAEYDYPVLGLCSARNLADDEVDLTVLTNIQMSCPIATVVSGTTTSIKISSSFYDMGINPGDRFVNENKKWTRTVTRISTTTRAYDTIHFEAAPSAPTVSNLCHFRHALFTPLAGEDQNDYLLTLNMQSAAMVYLQSSIIMRVRGADTEGDQ